MHFVNINYTFNMNEKAKRFSVVADEMLGELQ
jgi:hypothetical protein